MLLGWTADTGAILRTTMKAMVLFGMPLEDRWPYRISTFDDEPDSFLYAHASNHQALQYLRLGPAGSKGDEVPGLLKVALAAGHAVMFGFSVCSSLDWEADIPLPAASDSLEGGHAGLAVGDDNDRQCRNAPPGPLLIRSSWGTDWGEDRYAWLPYTYVLAGLATDLWTCFKAEWVPGQIE
jgi:C1A family cysteine protease